MSKKKLIIGFGILFTSFIQAQSLTLEDCYQLARDNYPALQKMDLIAKSGDYTIKNANKAYLPQLNISAQATYQSQVVNYGELLGQNSESIGFLPDFSKDQYKLQAEVEQLLFDGGNIRYQNQITKYNTSLQTQNIEVDLYAIKERINAIFFSIFLLDSQLEVNSLKIATLKTQVDKAHINYKHGNAYLSDINELQAEIENTESINIGYQSNRNAFLKMLSIFTGKELITSKDLIKPDFLLESKEINRPELRLFDLQKEMYQAESKQLKSNYFPTINAFIQGAYGRPTLNPISDDFGSWYVAGVRLKWSIGNLYTLKNKRSIINSKSQIASTDKETFILNVQLDLTQQEENQKKYAEMIEKDKNTINLREKITQSATAQLTNGVITTHEYIQKVNEENIAKQNLILHQIQLLEAQYNLKFKSGN